jgi:hypothetical protein
MVQQQDSTDPTGVATDGKSHATVHRARERKSNAALEMRLAGASWDDIAEVLGYPTARQAIVATEKALERELKTEHSQATMRTLAGRRLERLLRAVWSKSIDPNHPDQLIAHQRALAVIDRHIKLYGLDAPTEMVVRSPSTEALEHWVATVVNQMAPQLPEGDIFADGEDEDYIDVEVVSDGISPA